MSKVYNGVLWECPHCKDYHTEPICFGETHQDLVGLDIPGEAFEADDWVQCDLCMHYCRKEDSKSFPSGGNELFYDTCPACDIPIYRIKCNSCGHRDNNSSVFPIKKKTAYIVQRRCPMCDSVDTEEDKSPPPVTMPHV